MTCVSFNQRWLEIIFHSFLQSLIHDISQRYIKLPFAKHWYLVLLCDRAYIIRYIARIWPQYSLRGLHIRITWFSPKTEWYVTTFGNCFDNVQLHVSASVTKGVLICYVVTVHWWRHRTHYDVTEAYPALRNILTVHLNNGATREDLRGIPKHCEVTAKAGSQWTIYTGDLIRFSSSIGME